MLRLRVRCISTPRTRFRRREQLRASKYVRKPYRQIRPDVEQTLPAHVGCLQRTELVLCAFSSCRFPGAASQEVLDIRDIPREERFETIMPEIATCMPPGASHYAFAPHWLTASRDLYCLQIVSIEREGTSCLSLSPSTCFLPSAIRSAGQCSVGCEPG